MKRHVDTPVRANLIPSMKTLPAILAVGTFLSATPAFSATSAIPERRNSDRYEKMQEDSPFALATPAAPVAEVVKGWASSLYVSGIGKNYISGKEQIFVGIKSRGEQTSFSLYGNDPNSEGISIGGIEWSDQLGKTKVTLKKGAEFATVTFDPQVISTPAAPVAAARNPGASGMMKPQPGLNPNANNSLPRPPAPGSAVPRPSAPPVLPQPLPSGLPTNSNSSNTNGAPNPAHRVRVIKSTP